MRGVGGFGVFDEVFHPDAKNAREIQEAEAILPAPTPLPGDPPFDLESGKVTIVLPSPEDESDAVPDDAAGRDDVEPTADPATTDEAPAGS